VIYCWGKKSRTTGLAKTVHSILAQTANILKTLIKRRLVNQPLQCVERLVWDRTRVYGSVSLINKYCIIAIYHWTLYTNTHTLLSSMLFAMCYPVFDIFQLSTE